MLVTEDGPWLSLWEDNKITAEVSKPFQSKFVCHTWMWITQLLGPQLLGKDGYKFFLGKNFFH